MAQPARTATTRALSVPTSSAFAAFYAEHQPKLRRYCAFRFGPDVADEVAAQVMERALQCFDTLDRERDPWAWLVVVARNAGINVVRASQQCATVELEELAALPAQRWSDPADAWDRQEQSVLVSAALARIPAGQRRVLLLRLHEELDFPSIAALLGTTENAVRQQLFKGRKAFAVAYRSLTGRAPALVPLGGVLALLRRLLRGPEVRTARSSVTASLSAGALTLASLGLALHLAVLGGAPSQEPVHLDTRNAAATLPAVRAEVVHGATPHAGTATVRVARDVAPPAAVERVAVAVTSSPLGVGQTHNVRISVDTPAGRLEYSSSASSDQVGPVCRTVTGLCG